MADAANLAQRVCKLWIPEDFRQFSGSFRKGFSRPAASSAHPLIKCSAELFPTAAKASLFGCYFEAYYGWTPPLTLLAINVLVDKILCSLFNSRRLAGNSVDFHKAAKGRSNKVLAFRLAQQPVDRGARAHCDFAQVLKTALSVFQSEKRCCIADRQSSPASAASRNAQISATVAGSSWSALSAT